MGRFSVCVFAVLAFAGISDAATITYNFGTGAGITSPPSPLGTSSTTYGTSAIDLGVTSFTLSPGITIGSTSDLSCIEGSSTSNCFGPSANVTTSNTSGLGVEDGTNPNRIDSGETVTITVAPGYIVTFDSFQLAGFSGNEQASYQIDGGGTTNVTPNGAVALDGYTINQSVANGAGGTIVFGSPNQVGGSTVSTYNLYSLTLDVTAVPEPASFGMLGLALLGLGAARRRFRR